MGSPKRYISHIYNVTKMRERLLVRAEQLRVLLLLLQLACLLQLVEELSKAVHRALVEAERQTVDVAYDTRAQSQWRSRVALVEEFAEHLQHITHAQRQLMIQHGDVDGE